MNEPLHLAGVDGFARDRIADLHATAWRRARPAGSATGRTA